MKEVKLVTLDELGADVAYWYHNLHDRRYGEQVKKDRAVVEQRLADLLNEGWQLESVVNSLMILVRER